ncbi:unnamed protein product, partial [Phaeothamnion confervicola]
MKRQAIHKKSEATLQSTKTAQHSTKMRSVGLIALFMTVKHATALNVSTALPDENLAAYVWQVAPGSHEHKSAIVTNLGGRGAYDNIVDIIPGVWPACTVPAGGCVKQRVCVDGPLAPFDEELSIALRGPLELYNFAAFEGRADGSFGRVSSWSRTTSDNVAFMNNQGGVAGCSGTWSVCQGNSQSYAAADGVACAATPQHFRGSLPADEQVNILTSKPCASKSDCGGAYRSSAMHGWRGGGKGGNAEKAFVFRVMMPHGGGTDRPAVWMLNAKTVRTAQWGCNCRGSGGNGGCGELDIIEV